MYYFDYTATTKPKEEILNLYNKISNEYWFNSETLYNLGKRSNDLITKSTSVILNSLNMHNKKVLFTSGATEANNTAIYSVCNQYLTNPKHIITTYVEHSSVLNVYKDLEARGFKVTYLIPDSQGLINISDLENSITPDTCLVSIMWVNNVMGTIEPIDKIIPIIKKHKRIKFHVDATQGLTKIKPNFNFDDIDFITCSSHKLEGLKGSGALIYNANMFISFMHGGHQQEGMRPGTCDVAGIACLAKAIQLSNSNLDERYSYVNNLYKFLINELDQIDFLHVNRCINYYSPYIISITFKSLKGETALHALEKDEIIVGTGSACNSKTNKKESTLDFVLPPTLNPINSIRISLSYHTTMDEVTYLINKIKELGKL